jgi:zinc protease
MPVRHGVLAVLVVVIFALGLSLPSGGARAVEVQRIMTPGGFDVWYNREANIPIISLSVAFRGGAALDPPGKEGLATLVVGLLNEGAGDMDSLAFQQAITNRAISLSVDAGFDIVSVGMDTISANRVEAFRLLGLALSAPRFDAPAVERVRRQLLSAIAADAKNPRSIATRTWFKTVFPDHPYGRPSDGTAESIAAITVDDLKTFAATRFARDNVVIAAAGNVPADEIAQLVDSALLDLPETSAPIAIAEAAFNALGRTIVEKLPIPQSVVSFGMPGLKREDPDFYAAYVMNEVLGGGGFTSRLYEEVREKRGLAYGVYSFLNPLDHVGLYLGGVATRNDQVALSIEIIRAEIARLAKDGISDEELTAAKGHLIGAFPLRWDSGGKIARMMVHNQLEGLGIDYFDRRNAIIDAVTTEDIARVAQRLLDPDLMTTVIVGDPEGLETTP